MGSAMYMCLLLAVLHKQPARGTVTTITSKDTLINSTQYGFSLRQGELLTFELQTCALTMFTTLALHYGYTPGAGMLYCYFDQCGFLALDKHVSLKRLTENCRDVHRVQPVCLKFWPYWIYWHGDNMDIGRGTERGINVLARINNIQAPIAYMILAGKAQWKFEIKDQDEEKAGAMFYSPLSMRNINITSNILRQRVLDIVELCAVECREEKACMSFTFDNSRKICQQHRTNYIDLTNVQYTKQSGVNYYQETN